MELHLPVILNFSINNQIAIPFWSKEVMEIHLKEKHIFLNQMNDFLNGLSFNSSITAFITNAEELKGSIQIRFIFDLNGYLFEVTSKSI
jgi:hypothetical protein